jgi:hypothetical protein
MKTLHISIISWDGKESAAEHIASKIDGLSEYLTIIYSTKDGLKRQGTGDWIQVSDEDFLGKKFKKALELNKGDIHLQIQADADCEDWPKLVSRCKQIHHKDENVGIWVPEISYTYWKTEKVKITNYIDSALISVAQTDTIVWSFTKSICDRLKKYNYEINNLGWGIDWAAISYALSNNALVLRDRSIQVLHLKGTGYNRNNAIAQMDQFLKQLSSQEKVIFNLLKTFIGNDKKFDIENLV